MSKYLSYIGFPEGVQVQLENVLSEVLPAGEELGGDEPDAVRAETLVVDTELHTGISPGPAEETENNNGHSEHLLCTMELLH